ncbi:MAG TPA: YggT family protein [Ktedonobacterales bacterium]|jgi:uncharacterized protein YggT (Ycf19 family)
MAILDALGHMNLAHTFITLLEGALIICLIVQMIFSWILRGDENRFSRFFTNVTGPMLRPLERVIPPVYLGSLPVSIAFLVLWWAIIMAAALLSQALPPGW